MNTILANLVDPAWWFSGFVPALAMLLAPRIWRQVGGVLKKVSRRNRKRRLEQVRRVRRDDLLISYEMQKVHTSFLVFMLCVVAGLILLTLSPYQGNKTIFPLFAFLLALPILTAEGVWLYRDSRVKDILKYRERLKVGRVKCANKSFERIAAG